MEFVATSRVKDARVLSANARHKNVIPRVDDFSTNHAPMTVLAAVMRVSSRPNRGGGFHGRYRLLRRPGRTLPRVR